MSNNKQRRGSGALGFIIALVLLAFVIFAGQTDVFGAVSENLRERLATLFTREAGGYESVIARILAAIAAIALTYIICRILCFILDKCSKSARTRTVNELIGNIVTYLGLSDAVPF